MSEYNDVETWGGNLTLSVNPSDILMEISFDHMYFDLHGILPVALFSSR